MSGCGADLARRARGEIEVGEVAGNGFASGWRLGSGWVAVGVRLCGDVVPSRRRLAGGRLSRDGKVRLALFEWSEPSLSSEARRWSGVRWMGVAFGGWP